MATALEIAFILVLVGLNGAFAMSELAIVSARRVPFPAAGRGMGAAAAPRPYRPEPEPRIP